MDGREKERERNIYVWLPPARPAPGTWPETQACALTGNQTCKPLLSQAHAQSTELYQPGPEILLLITRWFCL